MGVWVETRAWRRTSQRGAVTPFMGVWVETPSRTSPARRSPRHALHGRVDRNEVSGTSVETQQVTPFMGVWVETS